jgi:tRNA A-37 threonylcarbamoyl transferase component Bud32
MSAVQAELPLSRAIIQVEEQWLAAEGDDYIHKVETTRNHGLRFELMLDGQPRWLYLQDGLWQELEISRDRKIPLAKKLRDAAYAKNTRILSYRPGRRLTLLNETHHKACIMKGFRRGHLERMITRYETAHCAFSGKGVNAPDIFEYDRASESLVMVYQPGQRLSLSMDATELFHLVGEAMRGFQDHDPADDDCFSARDELNVIDKRAKRLRRATGSLPPNWPELRKRLESVIESLPSPCYGLAHRDLHDKQFVQQANHLTLLDFDLMCSADTTLDPANFLAHLVLRNLQGIQGATQRSIDACGKQFLQGLGRNTEPGFWERLRFYQATSFCRLALIYVLRPRWDRLVPDLVTMGNRCLDDLQRIGGS